VVGFFQTIGDADAGGQTQTVDRRVHQRDDRDITVDFVFSCHAGLPLCEKLKKNDRSFLIIVDTKTSLTAKILSQKGPGAPV
jgi:hypothetical protein